MNLQQKDGATSIVGLKKNCMEGSETSRTKLPKKALRINSEKNGSCHSGPGWTHQILIRLNGD